MTILKFQHSNIAEKDQTLATPLIKKQENNHSDDSSADEKKKKHDREVTEEYLKREVPITKLGSQITSSKVFQSATNSTITEEDITKQLEFIRRRAEAKRFAEDFKQDEDSINEYQVSDFVKGEWNTLARYNAKVNP